jgi:hypothetical protein
VGPQAFEGESEHVSIVNVRDVSGVGRWSLP